jgi:hypothetical protein
MKKGRPHPERAALRWRGSRGQFTKWHTFDEATALGKTACGLSIPPPNPGRKKNNKHNEDVYCRSCFGGAS